MTLSRNVILQIESPQDQQKRAENKEMKTMQAVFGKQITVLHLKFLLR